MKKTGAPKKPAGTARKGTTRKRGPGRPGPDFSAPATLLAGAGQAFAAKGYADTSVEDICRASGVSRRTFYRFFANKEAVFAALFEVAAGRLVESVRWQVEQSEPAPQAMLEAGIDAYLRITCGAGPIARVLFLEPRSANSPFSARHAEVIAGFADIFQNSMRRLGLAPADPLLLQGLLAAIESISIELMERGPVDEEALQHGRRVMLRLSASLTLPEDLPIPAR